MTEMERSIFPDDIVTNGLSGAVIIGIVAAIIGAFSVAETSLNMGLMRREVLEPLQHFSGNTLLLLLGKVIIDLSFSITALLLLYLSEKVRWTGIFSPATGLVQMILIICFISFFWDPGWSQILEPSGNFIAPLLQIVLSFLQSFAFIIAGVRR